MCVSKVCRFMINGRPIKKVLTHVTNKKWQILSQEKAFFYMNEEKLLAKSLIFSSTHKICHIFGIRKPKYSFS